MYLCYCDEMASTYALIGKSSNLAVSGKSVKSSFEKSGKSFKFHGCFPVKDQQGDFYKGSIQSHVKNAVVNGQSASIVAFAVSENDDLGSQFGQSFGVVQSAIDDVYSLSSKDQSFAVASSMLKVSTNGLLLDALNPHSRNIILKHHATTGIYADGLSDLISATSNDMKRLFDEGLKVVTSQSGMAYLYTITMWKNITDKKSSATREIRSTLTFLFVGITNDSSAQIDEVMKQATKPQPTEKVENNLTLLLRDCIHSNCSVCVGIACVMKTDCTSAEAHSCLSNTEMIATIPVNKEQTKVVDTNTLLSNLREELAAIRQKVALDVVPKIKDVEKMEKLMEDIRETKSCHKSQVQWKSERYFAERKANYANIGLAWILAGSALSHVDQAKINEQKKLIEKLSEDHRKQKDATDKLNTELKSNIANYTENVNKGTENKDQVGVIQKLKEQSRLENEKLKQLRSNLKVARKQLQGDTQTATSTDSASFQFLYKTKCEEISKLKEENEQIIQQEIDNIKAEIERERVNIEMKYSKEDDVDKQQVIKMAVDNAALNCEKNVLTTQLDALKRERVEMMLTISELSKKHEQEMEVQQLQNLQTFRAYREMFENYKLELENRWRNLLGEAIQDAVFLASRNSQLNEQNMVVKQENNRLKESVGENK